MENNRLQRQTKLILDVLDHISHFRIATHSPAAPSSLVSITAYWCRRFLSHFIISILFRFPFFRKPNACFIWRPESSLLNVADTLVPLESYVVTGTHTYTL